MYGKKHHKNNIITIKTLSLFNLNFFNNIKSGIKINKNKNPLRNNCNLKKKPFK